MLVELLNPEAHGVKPAATAAFARFTLEHGVFAHQTFIAGLRVCENPCCSCEAVGFACRPARQQDTGSAAPESAPLSFDLDVFHRQVNTAIQRSPDSETLALAVAAEMQEPDWQRLADLFLNTKRRVMKAMDIDAVRAQFPRGTRGKKGAMVGYVEIFPWADILRPTIAETLPADWETRLHPVAGYDNVFALDPYDLAVVKLMVGRAKDLDASLFSVEWSRSFAPTEGPEPPGRRARVPQGRPKIAQRFIAGLRVGGPEVPQGRKNARLAEPEAVIPVVPPGLDRSWLPRPSDESLGYSLSPFGLIRIPFP